MMPSNHLIISAVKRGLDAKNMELVGAQRLNAFLLPDIVDIVSGYIAPYLVDTEK